MLMIGKILLFYLAPVNEGVLEKMIKDNEITETFYLMGEFRNEFKQAVQKIP